ncbi:hypothetical protein JCM30237_17330 [Halolamina litorea]|uniref:Uncharacterized protein n=1 Tax=Halolamina litorea TaxID=1515593 RepID=A0ABD6BWW8_9EURY|nr:hypothetical protein [Halolamina litorea]
MAESSVELPANEEIKQLSHDIVREGNQYAVPLIRDFYTFLAALDEEAYTGLADLDVKDAQSEMPPRAWRDCLSILQKQGIVEKSRGTTTKYRLDSE